MTGAAPEYAGRTVAFATMHGKERLAAEPFRRELGARVIAAIGVNTDLLGTFAGDIPRELSPLDAARAKARLGMELTGTSLGLASEGTFTNSFGIVENTELLLFVDDALGIDVVETSVTDSPMAGPRVIADAAAGLAFAERVGFPRQGIIISTSDGDTSTWHKEIRTGEALASTLAGLFDAISDTGEVIIHPDYRAHASPSRAAHIRSLAGQLARRLATPCPRCSAPGWGLVDSEPGLPCRDCGEPTGLVAVEIRGCPRCTHRIRTSTTSRTASPDWCEHCNP